MQELNQKIIEWAKERGIDKNGTMEGQIIKTVEEISELIKGICKDDINLIKDSIGDVYVTLVVGNMLSQKSIDIYKAVRKEEKYYEDYGSKRLEDKYKEKIRLLKCVSEGMNYILSYLYYEKTTINRIISRLLDVTLTYGTTLEECVEIAYNKIKNQICIKLQ